MSTKILTKLVIVLISVCACAAWAQTARPSGIALGVRQYTGHSSDPDSPFGEGDLSYLAVYEYHDVKAYWQFGASFTPHASSTSMVQTVESVITPQIRLIFNEEVLMLGVGVLKHYVQGENENHWSPLYWEIEAGLHTMITPRIDLRGIAYYSFREWGDIGDFDTSQIELGLEVCYRF